MFTLLGWGLLVPAAGTYFLFRYQARKLDEGVLLKWQRNWERKRGYRRPIKEFATVYLRGAKQIRLASYISGGFLLLGLVFNSYILLGILATRSQHVLQDRGVITALWAEGVLDFGVLLPAYLCAIVISRSWRALGEKIVLVANRLDREVTGQNPAD